VSFYLAAVGVGCLRICDSQTLELSNLNRQILYNETDVGYSKADRAKRQLMLRNSEIEIVACEQIIGPDTVADLVADADIIVDCLDNYASRVILNAFAVERGLPLVHGGVTQWFGQLTFIHSPQTPCLCCLFPELKDKGVSPIVGAAAGVIGSLQAVEVLKYLVGCGELLKNRMLYWTGETMQFYERDIRKSPDCPVCGVQ
jgi:adenylyltransferase/sulfurtransferase